MFKQMLFQVRGKYKKSVSYQKIPFQSYDFTKIYQPENFMNNLDFIFKTNLPALEFFERTYYVQMATIKNSLKCPNYVAM